MLFLFPVFNDIEDRSIIFNESYSSENGDVVISTNTSKALVSIRMLLLNGTTGLVLRYYSEASPDNKGNRFVIPDGDILVVSTYNSQNVTVHNYCDSSDFNVSIDTSYVLAIGNNVADLQANGDIIVYKQSFEYFPICAVMPFDVLGTKYIILSANRGARITVTGVGITTIVNLTFPECPGNCSLPSCARRDVSFQLDQQMKCHRHIHSCQLDLTGSIITSDFPVSVMVATGGLGSLILPPVNTWGRKFIIASFPAGDQLYRRTTILKMVSKVANTNVTIRCYRPNATLVKYDFYLNESGDHINQSISIDRNCLMQSNKPVLPMQILTGYGDKFIIPPVEQYSSDYLLPPDLCKSPYSTRLYSLVIISETKYIDGLRMDGMFMSILQIQKIGKTGYSRVFVDLIVPTLHRLHHIEPNIVFGVFVDCEMYVIPLGMRMASIDEKCKPTLSIPGDGLDNDCDELIDEDKCDTNSADVNSNSDCAATSQVILPCLGYIDTNGVVWKTTMPNNYDYQTCLKGSTGQTSNLCELKEGRYGVWKGPDTSFCVSEALSIIAAKLHLTLNGTSNIKLADVLNETLGVTNKLISKDNFNAGNLKSVIDSLDLVVTIIEERSSLGTTKLEREVLYHLLQIIEYLDLLFCPLS
ncbi:Hypothetical predicted protein [Mytilus galloprovincialis]|uniref:G-protein coupled receptors family 2 profile 1 domain-containing protein n=1 Tax=Mytilus galloprovincialis TaxID=29158 RepID=A0A8B6DNA0_MYTGA|nr:Hypothetical predicted protein [Mytilus galloprovincialis]